MKGLVQDRAKLKIQNQPQYRDGDKLKIHIQPQYRDKLKIHNQPRDRDRDKGKIHIQPQYQDGKIFIQPRDRGLSKSAGGLPGIWWRTTSM